MPLYDMKCDSCGKEFEHFCRIDDRENVRCNCGGRGIVILTNYRSKDWFPTDGFYHPNFDIEPVHVKSKKHFKELCKHYNMTSRAL